jgi:glycosyltransferase involved in cell wall biosynthesis
VTARAVIATSWNRSAVSYQFRRLAQSLAERGVEVHFLDDRRKDVPLEAGVQEIHHWPGTGRPGGVGAVRYASSLVRRLEPQIVVANFVAVTPLGLAARAARVPVRVCWYHSASDALRIDTEAARGGALGPVAEARRTVQLARKRLVYLTYTDIVAVSAQTAEDVVRTYKVPPGRVAVHENAVIDGPVRDHEPGPDAPVVAVGRLHTSKGHAVLIDAVARMTDRRPLVIAGEGPERARLESLAAELGVDLRLPGVASNAAARQLMARAAVVAVPSLSEGFGLTAIEGFAAGVPVVASAAGGLRDLIDDGVEGYLCPPGDPGALAARLDDAVRPEANGELGRRARQTFLERFEVGKRADVIADWLVERLP